MPAPGATATNIGAGGLAIVRRALEELTNALSPSSTKHNPEDERWPSDQLTIGLLCHLDTGRCPWDNGSFGSFLFFCRAAARARRSMAAALSTRLLRRGSCR